ncbi:MAG: hypothetical protein IKW74_04515, partial [Thermoguttaceae bacterium]|nr:hypothetical protein [Thermoguttaceae bacterium]
MNGKFLSKHQHLFLTIGSFLAVYLVYLLYAYVLCPFEPVRPNRIVMKETPSSKREEIAGFLEQLFSPDDWRCKMENFFFTKGENCLLLFRSEPVLSQYQISADACTLIFLSNEYESIQERYRHAFIMETNDPIVLSFSRELSLEMLGMFDFADFEKGEFKGQVILRCKMESDGNEDEFFLSTRNIIFDTKQIRTREPVSFRLGKNLGEGEDLTIDIQLPLTVYQSKDLITDENRTLTPAEQIRRIVNNGNLGSGISLQRIELAKIKKFDFQPDLSGLKSSKETLSGKKDEPHSESRGPDGNFPTDVFAADSREKKETLPISITCENGVYFAPNPENPAGWIARFMENVEVVIYHEDEEQDTLNCKNLYLYLVDPELEQLAQETSNFRNIHLKKTPSGRLSVLQPVIVRAIRSEKSPLKISFPRFEFLALQDELIYDIRKKYLSLMAESKEEPIRLQKGTMTLTATKILYGPDANPASTMGTVYVENGGSLESLLPKTEDKYLRIFWEKGLQVFLEPSDLSLVHLMMTGQVTFKADGMATITAEGADFWGRLPNRNDDGSAQREPADPSEAPVFRQAGYNSSVPEVNENKIAGQLSAITPESIVFQKNIVLDSPQGKGNIKNKLTVRIDTQNNQKKEAASTHPPVVPHTSPISEESLKKTF